MATRTSAKAKPEIDPDAYYDVRVTTPVTFERARFGPQAAVEISGAMLVRLLDSDQAALVASYAAKA